MDYTLEDVLAEVTLFLPAVEILSDFKARWHLRSPGNRDLVRKRNNFILTNIIYMIFLYLRLYSQSFIRAYVLDNFYICILMYILFYAALWYANYVSNHYDWKPKVAQLIRKINILNAKLILTRFSIQLFKIIKRIEKSNREMSTTVAENKTVSLGLWHLLIRDQCFYFTWFLELIIHY